MSKTYRKEKLSGGKFKRVNTHRDLPDMDLEDYDEYGLPINYPDMEDKRADYNAKHIHPEEESPKPRQD